MDFGVRFQKSNSGFGINTSTISCLPIFSQNGQHLVFRPKFWEIAQLCAIFWFKYCWGCCRELGGGWNQLGGGGWRWVHGLVIPFDDIFKNLSLVVSYSPFMVRSQWHYWSSYCTRNIPGRRFHFVGSVHILCNQVGRGGVSRYDHIS